MGSVSVLHLGSTKLYINGHKSGTNITACRLDPLPVGVSVPVLKKTGELTE